MYVVVVHFYIFRIKQGKKNYISLVTSPGVKVKVTTHPINLIFSFHESQTLTDPSDSAPGTPSTVERESLKMESSHLLSDRVLVNGTETRLTLSANGALTWIAPEGRQLRLMIEKDVLGFDLEGSTLRVRAIVDTEVACCAVGGTGGSLIKKDLVFEPLSDESRSLWCHKLQGYLGSLGL